MARLYNVSPNAIRCSVGRIKNALVNLQDEGILTLKDILKDLKVLNISFWKKFVNIVEKF